MQVAAVTPLATPRRLEIMATDCAEQLTFWKLGGQQVSVTFDGGEIVSDAGLLPLRTLDKELGVLSELAQRLPDPRAQKFVIHSPAVNNTPFSSAGPAPARVFAPGVDVRSTGQPGDWL